MASDELQLEAQAMREEPMWRDGHYRFEFDGQSKPEEISWGGRRGLNPRHSVPQTDALPAELLPPHFCSLPRDPAAQNSCRVRSLTGLDFA
jgi:hypothetical protein